MILTISLEIAWANNKKKFPKICNIILISYCTALLFLLCLPMAFSLKNSLAKIQPNE